MIFPCKFIGFRQIKSVFIPIFFVPHAFSDRFYLNLLKITNDRLSAIRASGVIVFVLLKHIIHLNYMNVQFLIPISNKHSENEQKALSVLDKGCKWLRIAKTEASDDEVRPVIERLLKACKAHKATLVIDDRPNLAKVVEADGVHLSDGKNIAETRQLIGEELIIGATLSEFDAIVQAKSQGADYIDCGPYPGIDALGLKNLMVRLYEADCALPISAYGHIVPNDVPAIAQTGVRAITTSDETFFEKDIFTIIHKFS